MLNKISKIKMFLPAIVVVAFLYVSLLGISTHWAMPADTTMAQSASCPFMLGESSLCATSIFDHISAWQSSTIGILSNALSLMLLLALTFIFSTLLLVGIMSRTPQLFSHERFRENFVFKKLREEILSWLSLFENSPSLSYIRHS